MISSPMEMMLNQGTFLYMGPTGVNNKPRAAVNRKIMAKKYRMPWYGPGPLRLKKKVRMKANRILQKNENKNRMSITKILRKILMQGQGKDDYCQQLNKD